MCTASTIHLKAATRPNWFTGQFQVDASRTACGRTLTPLHDDGLTEEAERVTCLDCMCQVVCVPVAA